jgi:hypothetical protein
MPYLKKSIFSFSIGGITPINSSAQTLRRQRHRFVNRAAGPANATIIEDEQGFLHKLFFVFTLV